ncbi:helix-turn-helix domain-containing protein [Allorhizocola rhizosphaerae]|uniref:helix-turn-helix domain-containing protein n=1 Tax=Allorhizocola rhizosphaerae TaxID=1872709 RepID=UPI000E3ED3F1|nr:helix-turn-helix domain-containing protein [Allorhizocola rhizosphaerae]
MLRIFFTAQDIARTRLAPAPDPLWEIVLSLQMLRGQRGDLLFSQWRRETARTLRRAELGPRLELLLALAPELGYFPDFITPDDSLRGMEYGLEAIRSAPNETMRHELALLEHSQLLRTGKRLPAGATRLARGEPAAVTELTQTMREYYELAIQPHQRGIEAAVQADRNLRLDAFAQAGIEGLLASLRPMMTWNAGELQVHGHRDQEIHLDGRGLLIIPSYFCVNHPMTMFDPTLPPVLIYPVSRSPANLPHGQRVALAGLIGQTRAAMLEAIAGGCTTSELARRVGVSAASASEHAAILRSARLITSHRDRNRMVHHVTRLGHALLNGL